MSAAELRFFIDRSLGAHGVPDALRDAGWQIVTMRERYGEVRGQATHDPDWIADASQLGEILICKDKKIARRPPEARAIVANGARAFALGNGEMTGPDMSARFLKHQVRIFRRCIEPGPYVFSVAEDHLERLKLHTG